MIAVKTPADPPPLSLASGRKFLACGSSIAKADEAWRSDDVSLPVKMKVGVLDPRRAADTCVPRHPYTESSGQSLPWHIES